MEEQKRTWGKLWTYFVVAGLMLSGYFLTWYLVEQRRDNDAAAFYKVSKSNEEQIWSLRRYVEAMPECQEKQEMLKILTPIRIVRTRAEVDSIRRTTDSIANFIGL